MIVVMSTERIQHVCVCICIFIYLSYMVYGRDVRSIFAKAALVVGGGGAVRWTSLIHRWVQQNNIEHVPALTKEKS